MPASTANAIQREVLIAARPETVFAFLTDPDKIVAWMGRKVEAEARPGGRLRVDYNGFDIMRGEFVEVVPHTRVVYSWGWESLADTVRPGQSLVEFTLATEGSGTRLRMVHSGLSEADARAHSEGWDHFLARLDTAATGGTADSMDVPLSDGEQFASRLNSLLVQTLETVEACPSQDWKAMTAESRARNVVAHHAAAHASLALVAKAVAAGEETPVSSFTLEMLTQMNAEHDREFADVTREQVIHDLKEQGPPAVEALKAMTDADLAASAPMAFAGGNSVPARALVEGPLLGDLADHLVSIRGAS